MSNKLLHNYHELNSREKRRYWLLDRWRLPSTDRFFFDGHRPLPGQMYTADRKALYDTIISQKPRYCFEIGTYTGGGSTFFLGSAFKHLGSGKLVTLETDEYFFNLAQNYYRNNLPQIGHYVKFLHGSNPDVFLPYIHECGGQVDCVFLDGSDNPQETVDQFNFFKQFTHQGTKLMVHDWNTQKTQLLRPILENDEQWQQILILNEPVSVGFVVYTHR